MANIRMLSLLSPMLLSALVFNCQCLERKLHIVYMGGRPQEDASAASTHHAMLHRVLGSGSLAKDSLGYSYGRSFNGFAAKLTQEEASRISEMDGVISVNPNRIHKLHTTRSRDFLNLTTNKLGAPQESDVIIGLLDTVGVWPERPSFNDTGFSPPPAKWKGTCTTTNLTCKNKIIGARYYNSDNCISKTFHPKRLGRSWDPHGLNCFWCRGGSRLFWSSKGSDKRRRAKFKNRCL